MSKSMLVMETPKGCAGCKLCYRSQVCTGTLGNGNKRVVDEKGFVMENQRPTWCPLKKVPELEVVKNASEYEFGNLGVAFVEGHNSCVRKILKDEKDNKMSIQDDEVAAVHEHEIIRIREWAASILDKFENILDEHSISIPDESREGAEEEACIYGMTYAKLEDDITNLLCLLIKTIKENPDADIEEYSY